MNAAITFRVITKILFGNDLDLERTYPYRYNDGSTKQVNLQHLFMHCVQDGLEEGYRPHNLMFPFLVRNNIGSENKRIFENNQTLNRVTGEFLK